MIVQRLDAGEETALRRASFTYAEVGRTATSPPSGYHSLARTVRLARRDFEQVADDLLSWQVQLRAGLRVAASDPMVTRDTVAVLRLGPGRISLRIPCRVVYVVDEPARQGFAYGTLPGHPETGEELFLLEHRADGAVDFTVSVFSRPATTLARLGGPVNRGAQRLMTARYLRVLDRRA